jgi:hypothetical protein
MLYKICMKIKTGKKRATKKEEKEKQYLPTST